MEKEKKENERLIRKLVSEMIGSYQTTPNRQDGPVGGKWDRSPASEPSGSSGVGKYFGDKPAGSKVVVNPNASESMIINMHRNEMADSFSMPVCRERRIYCRCAYCTIRKRLDNDGHPDNQDHRENCPHCSIFQARKYYRSGFYNFNPIIALFEVFSQDELDPVDPAAHLVEQLASALGQRTTTIFGQIGFIEPIDDLNMIYNLAVTNADLIEMLTPFNDRYTTTLIIHPSDVKSGFEDLEAFWKTNSTLQSVSATQGACLRNVVVAPMDFPFEVNQEGNDENLAPVKFKAGYHRGEWGNNLKKRLSSGEEVQKNRKRKSMPDDRIFERYERPAPASVPKKTAKKALFPKKSKSYIELMYLDENSDNDAFIKCNNDGSLDVSGPETSELSLGGPTTSNSNRSGNGNSEVAGPSTSVIENDGPSNSNGSGFGLGNEETDVDDSDTEGLD